VGETEFVRARRYQRPLSCLMLDLDHFKSINDRHGHAAGDEVLRAAAKACRDSVRELDLLGRFGGEELVALLPETEASIAASVVAERIRRTVEALCVKAGEHTVTVTVSIGVADNASAGSLEELLAAADRALYAAKRLGRNRVARDEPLRDSA